MCVLCVCVRVRACVGVFACVHSENLRHVPHRMLSAPQLLFHLGLDGRHGPRSMRLAAGPPLLSVVDPDLAAPVHALLTASADGRYGV
jgi:hypothetical protein